MAEPKVRGRCSLSRPDQLQPHCRDNRTPMPLFLFNCSSKTTSIIETWQGNISVSHRIVKETKRDKRRREELRSARESAAGAEDEREEWRRQERRGEDVGEPPVPCRHTTLLFHHHTRSPKPRRSVGVSTLNHKRGPDLPPKYTFTYCKDGGGLRSTHTHEAQTLCDAVKKPLMQKGEMLKKKKR